ncbi:hypothetical protein ACP4OV_029375 [Aristida adscensionis]
MIDIWSAVQWWDEWQLRILVIASMGFQWFLLLAAPLRNYTIPRWFRTFIWLAYISADALAIYALATLFNRHARATSGCDSGAKGSSLEVLWAPLLLVYLGGREEITAYNIEDNELWTRHTVTLVSQVTVALYAFYKSWPSSNDRKLLLSAILLFIVGILSFCEKPWALRRASINRLVAMSSLMKGERQTPRGWNWCFTELSDRYKCWKELPQGSTPILSQGDKVQMILSDLSLYAAKVTLEKRKKSSDQEVLESLRLDRDFNMRHWVRQAFGLIYTRANVIFTPAYLACHVLLVPSLYIAAIMLFARSHKHGYNRTDVKTTYFLLFFTLVLDVFGLLISEMIYWLLSSKTRLPALCENLPDHNLIGSIIWTMRKSATGLLFKCAKRIGYKEGYFGSKGDHVYGSVSQFITRDLLGVTSKAKNADLSSYRSFMGDNNWTLRNFVNKDICGTSTMVRRILRKSPFDSSVLVWHIATDLCFRRKPPKYFTCRPPHDEVLRELCTEAISNYMVYLLDFQPEMLLSGSRQHLFTEAKQHMERILKEATEGLKPKPREKQPFDQTILDKIKEKAKNLADDPHIKYSHIHQACLLAEELLKIQDDATRWELMYRVWVGMLCYSASMCRGYLHAKSLGEGGEFLSYVWLVISLSGAKTLSDKLQMPDPEPDDPPEDEKHQEEEFIF